MPIASLICGAVSLLMAIGGFFTTAVPFLGSVLAFGSPVVALAGIVMGGIGHSRSQDMKGVAVAGLVTSIIGFVFGLLVAVTCGMCNVCFSAGAAGTAGAAQGMGSVFDPNNWPDPDPYAGGGPPPFQGTPTDQQAPIEGATAPPVPVDDVLEHLNRTCPDAWCAPTNRDYLFTHVSCNASLCALGFTAFHFDRDVSGPHQGRVQIAREAIQPGSEPGSVMPEPLDAALSTKLEGWAPTATDFDGLEETNHPELRFVAWANDTCPDSWCEGELSYDYRHVRCAGEECTLFFRWGDYQEDTDAYRWVPGQMTVPRAIITELPDEMGDDQTRFDEFMELTGAFTAAHAHR